MANTYTVHSNGTDIPVRVAPGAGADAATKLAYLGQQLHSIKIQTVVLQSIIGQIQELSAQSAREFEMYGRQVEAIKRER